MTCPACHNTRRLKVGHDGSSIACPACEVWSELEACREQHDRDVALMAIKDDLLRHTIEFYDSLTERYMGTIAELRKGETT